MLKSGSKIKCRIDVPVADTEWPNVVYKDGQKTPDCVTHPYKIISLLVNNNTSMSSFRHIPYLPITVYICY